MTTSKSKSDVQVLWSTEISRETNYFQNIVLVVFYLFLSGLRTSEKKEDTTIFECKIYRDTECIETGHGVTKKKAEQEASKKALQKYHVIS